MIVMASMTVAAIAAVTPAAAPQTDADDFLLVGRTLDVEEVELVELGSRDLVHLDDEAWRTVALDECVCLIRADARADHVTTGVIELTDGQRLPGRAGDGDDDDEAVSWVHPILGDLAIPIDRVSSLVLQRNAVAPSGAEGDVVQLANGDRLEGFLVGIGDAVEIEVDGEDGPAIVAVPRDRVTAIRIVSTHAESTGTRVWFDDGTVLDVSSISVGDDGWVETKGDFLGPDGRRFELAQIHAIRFATEAMHALADLRTVAVEGPPTRYRVPAPEISGTAAPLGLAPIRISGPVEVRWRLPEGAQRFAAEAVLPADALAFGDYEMVIRDESGEIYRAHLDGGAPAASINVGISGRELTIELTEGARGPVQDALVLHRAMVLTE